MVSRIVLQSVLLNISHEHGIFPLVDNERSSQLLEQFCRCNGLFFIVIGNSHIQCLTGPDDAVQCTNSLLQRCIWIRSVMIEYIYIIQSHTLQALIQAGYQILFAAPVAVRSGPHIITGFRRNHQFITIPSQSFCKDPSKILLSTARYRSIIICQIKMCNAMIKCCMAHVLHIVKIAVGAEIMPQSQRNCRKQQSADAAAVVFHFFISFFICLIHLNTSVFPCFLYYKFIVLPFLCIFYRIKCNILQRNYFLRITTFSRLKNR